MIRFAVSIHDAAYQDEGYPGYLNTFGVIWAKISFPKLCLGNTAIKGICEST